MTERDEDPPALLDGQLGCESMWARASRMWRFSAEKASDMSRNEPA